MTFMDICAYYEVNFCFGKFSKILKKLSYRTLTLYFCFILLNYKILKGEYNFTIRFMY